MQLFSCWLACLSSVGVLTDNQSQTQSRMKHDMLKDVFLQIGDCKQVCADEDKIGGMPTL